MTTADLTNWTPSEVDTALGNWATCPVCHTSQTVTSGSVMRKHKTPKS